MPRRPAFRVLFALGCITLGCIALAPFTARAADGESTPAGEPKWRIEASPLGYSSSYAGIHRRLGPHSSIGLILGGTLRSDDGSGTTRHIVPLTPGEGNRVEESSSHDRAISARLEWRHRQTIASHASWYWGLGISGGYEDSRDKSSFVSSLYSTTEQFSRSTHYWGGGFGGFVTLGAEWVVASRFGVSMALTPLAESYRGTTQRYEEARGANAERYIDRNEHSGWTGTLSLSPAASVVLRF